jgi:phosphopantothenoylcysteine decarboxylase/phosphopantothenate--cysteine ligase
LACGDTGAGRMSEPETIVRAIVSLLCPKRDFAGLRVLVTAGATRERLDPVRYMTNDSSGKMGFALAEAARNRGAQVTVIAGSTTAPVPDGIDIRRVESTQDLFDAVTTTAPDMDVVIQAAAPADYRFAVTYPQKHKKAHDGQPFVVELVENPDIAAAVGAAKKPGQVLVGFAAETENLLQNAHRKLESKHLDLIVLNDVSQPGAGFNVDTNIATLITPDSQTEYPLRTKKQLAEDILDAVLDIRKQKKV